MAKTDKSKKTKHLDLRLSEEENERLRDLAKDYPSISSFVLDACWHFDGKLHLNKLEYIDKKYRVLLSLKNEVSHLSGNLNQLIQYTNRCINMGVYLENTSAEELEKELKDIIKKI